jgi:hypothetical protein
MKKPLEILKEPFPTPGQSANAYRISIIIGISIVGILTMFQPFGLSQLQTPEKYFIIGGYGLVTAVIVSLFLQLLPHLFTKLFNERNWVVWKHGVWLLVLLLTIGIGNLLYTNAIFTHYQFTLGNLLMFEVFTLMVGIFPVTGSILYSYIKHLKQNMALVQVLQTSKSERANLLIEEQATIVLTGANKGEELTISANDLQFMKSEGNYLKIYYLIEKRTHQKIIRSTLKNMLNQTDEIKSIIRCHRAFIVNTSHISQATGNAQGLKLTLNHTKEIIPVSRNYVSIVKSAVRK